LGATEPHPLLFPNNHFCVLWTPLCFGTLVFNHSLSGWIFILFWWWCHYPKTKCISNLSIVVWHLIITPRARLDFIFNFTLSKLKTPFYSKKKVTFLTIYLNMVLKYFLFFIFINLSHLCWHGHLPTPCPLVQIAWSLFH